MQIGQLFTEKLGTFKSIARVAPINLAYSYYRVPVCKSNIIFLKKICQGWKKNVVGMYILFSITEIYFVFQHSRNSENEPE